MIESLRRRLATALDRRPPVLLAETLTGSKVHQLLDPVTGPKGYEDAYRNHTVCGIQETRATGYAYGPKVEERWSNALQAYSGKIAAITCRACLRHRRERNWRGVSFPHFLYPSQTSEEYYARTVWAEIPGLSA